MEPFIPLILLAIIVTHLIMLVMIFAVIRIIYTIEYIYAGYQGLPPKGDMTKEYDVLFKRFIHNISCTRKNLPWFVGIFMSMLVCLLFLQGILPVARGYPKIYNYDQVKYIEALLMIIVYFWLTWRIGYIQGKFGFDKITNESTVFVLLFLFRKKEQ